MNTQSKHTPGPWHVALGLKLISDVYAVGVNGQRVFIAECATQRDALLIAAAPAMYTTIQHLLEWAKGNRGAKTGNPYCIPEVRHALKTLASIQGVNDYLNADTTVEGGL